MQSKKDNIVQFPEKTKNEEQLADLEQELETLKSVCNDYKKQKSLNIQIFMTVFAVILLYCQQYVLKNEIDIGFSHAFIVYVGIGCVLSIILGWVSHILEFYVQNEKIFKTGQYIIWGIEGLAVVVFLVLLFI